MCLVCIINAEESRTSQTPDVVDSDKKDDDDIKQENLHAIHYFAIGSMTNMTALALRDLIPISSQPAVLEGWRLVFRGAGGMATAEKMGEFETIDQDAEDYPFNGIHGVLHLLNPVQMKMLDEIEGGYNRVECTVNLYDGSTKVSAFVYTMDRSKWVTTGNNGDKMHYKHELPTERYLDIIAQGCVSHGVEPAWVEFVRNHKCVPRKPPTEFFSFSTKMTTTTIPIISWADIQKNNGKDGNKLWIVINNKVLEFVGDNKSYFPFGYFVKNNLGGTDFTLKFARGFYEPKYLYAGSRGGPESGGFHRITSSNELGIEHRSWIEDQFANPPPVLASSKWVFVGVVDAASSPVMMPPQSSPPSHASSTTTTTSATTSRPPSVTSLPTLTVAKVLSLPPPPPGSSPLGSPSKKFSAVLNLTRDVADGCSRFYIGGNTSGEWIIPDGAFIGHTIYLRKTATENFDGPVFIDIKHQTLDSPNRVENTYVMTPTTYFVSFSWDGSLWYLEQVGSAPR